MDSSAITTYVPRRVKSNEGFANDLRVIHSSVVLLVMFG